MPERGWEEWQAESKTKSNKKGVIRFIRKGVCRKVMIFGQIFFTVSDK
jgi:hypothetical protein